MSALGIYIVVGDLLISGVIIGLAIWLFAYRADDKSLEEAARIPLDEPKGLNEK